MARTRSTKATEAKPEGPIEAPSTEPKTRTKRGDKGWLAKAVKTITDEFTTGEIVLEKGQKLTPHRVAKIVHERFKTEVVPSTGAVTAVFTRWQGYGFATFNDTPFSFKAYTAEGKKKGLQAMLDERAAARKSITTERQSAAKAVKDAERAEVKKVKDAEKAKVAAEKAAAKEAAAKEKAAADKAAAAA